MQGRPRRRPGAHALRQLYRLALGARVLPRLHRLRLRPVCGRELPRHAGRPRPRARRTHPRRGRHLPGALLRAARPRPARLMTGHDEMLTTRDRFRGALLGLAVGEALGAPADFLTAAQIEERHGVITELLGGGCHDVARGMTTHAAVMVVCAAVGQAFRQAFDPEDIMQRYLAWFDGTPRDVSLT